MYKEDEFEKDTQILAHTVSIDARERMNITGVEDVVSFDENEIELYTGAGMLTISGENLHIEKLNIESGGLLVVGQIDAAVYTDEEPPKKTFFGRLFG